MPNTYWSPNQATIAQVRTYTFTAPSSVGNTYNATINGKTVTYSSVSGDTAVLVATGLFNLLNVTTSIPSEFAEITFTNPSSGTMVATARVPGVPFAGVTINGVSGQGLVLSTGNGLANGITTADTTPNKSPSDVYDAENWLRVTAPAPGARQLPQNGDDVVLGSAVPLLWNLDRLAGVQFATYLRLQAQTGEIGLSPVNANGGYSEWRARNFSFVGPQGSVPAGGLQMVLGQGTTGRGPSAERYNVGSQKVTLTCIAGGSVDFIGVHTDNTFTVLGGVTLNVAMNDGEISSLSSSLVDGGSRCRVGSGVTWTAGSTLNVISGAVELSAAPATLALSSGSQATFIKDGLTWATITAQGGCGMVWRCGGTVTNLTMSAGCVLDKSTDARTLTITNSTIDGDTCQFVDPLNAIVYTNATSVKQRVAQGPFTFTGPRTVKVT